MSKPISKEMAGQGAPGDEFIVEVDFDYCDVNYSGYEILTRAQIVKLCEQLDTDRQIGTPNMPGSWWEEFEISELKGAFTIHSEGAEDIEAMRGLFGDAVGNTELIDSVLDVCVEVEIIDEGIAQQFIDDSESVDLSTATRITDAAADILSKYEGGDEIYLNGLTHINSHVAWALSKIEGGGIYLNSLTELSEDAAKAFVERGALPEFGSLTGYSPAVLNVLIGLEGDDFFLFNIGELSEEAAKIIMSRETDTLSLEGITKISSEAAILIAGHNGDELSLEFASPIDKATVDALSNYTGKYFTIGGEEEMVLEVVTALAKRRGHLRIENLTELSSETAGVLAQHHGDLDLEGLTELSSEAAQVLAMHDGALGFGQLTDLSAEAAEALAGHHHEISFGGFDGGLYEINEDLGKALAQHAGDLLIAGWTKISLEAAEALANHQANINLRCLNEISDEVREVLAKKDSVILPE